LGRMLQTNRLIETLVEMDIQALLLLQLKPFHF